MTARSTPVCTLVAAFLLSAPGCGPRAVSRLPNAALHHGLAEPNDNRRGAGKLEHNVLSIDLEAVVVGWRPDEDVDSAVTVQAFAERGKAPRIPGPLLRVRQGTEVRATITNRVADSTLVVHGLRAGTLANDTITVGPNATREFRFRATAVGTFMYWGTTSRSLLNRRIGRDGQLTGAIVVDPAGGTVKSKDDRIFVITLIHINPDTTKPQPREDVIELAVNGRSWPHTERLFYSVGDTARWRWVNGSNRSHPMHLHGFHFKVVAKGSGASDTAYARDAQRLAVTELMAPGSTFQLEWELTRPGNWLVHCHMIPHIVPHPSRPDIVRMHDIHTVALHPSYSMAGLVIGVTVRDPARRYRSPKGRAVASHRFFLQQERADSGRRARKGFVLQQGAEPRADSVDVPGKPLVVVRGQRTSVTLINRLTGPSSVHWHGMELESIYDGVAGYSGVGSRRAPLIAPGDSFTVWFTPPRSGTYMYHSHMDEEDQLGAGMYGPLIVLDPGSTWDPDTDLTFMLGSIPGDSRGYAPALNGSGSPKPIILRAGQRHRLRIINIHLAVMVRVQLLSADSLLQRWRLVSKDGATVHSSRTGEQPAQLRLGVGEAYDFEWTPSPGQFTLLADLVGPPGTSPLFPIYQQFIVRP